MSRSLFNEFDPVSAKQWKQKIQADLKGASYEEVITPTREAIDIKPFYHQETDGVTHHIKSPHNWLISEEIAVQAFAEKNCDPFAKGTEHYTLRCDKDSTELQTLLKALPEDFPVHITATTDPKNLHEALKNKSHQHLSFSFDPIAQLAYRGNWFVNQAEDFKALVEHVQHDYATLEVDIRGYHEAGATITQQLAYVLAHTYEYFNVIHQQKKELNTIRLITNTAVGGNYFFEIAKLKAIRLLLHTLSKEFSFELDLTIIASPGKRNKTLYDYNTNMLRTTTECMSAILGGANVVCNRPYDDLYHEPNEFGDRIARNQLLILKHESYFDVVKNPADGAYYIETLVNQLSENALYIFKQIEQGGGFLKQLKEGVIQRKIKEQATKEQQAFDEQAKVLVGTNKFENKEDQMQQTIEKHPFLNSKSRKTLIEPIIQRRLAEKLEQERLNAETSA